LLPWERRYGIVPGEMHAHISLAYM
jgi:hypothetical protein